MESFWIAFYAVIPFLLYMSFGAFVRKVGWAEESFLNKLNTLVFKAFFPLLMFKNIYWMDTAFEVNVPFVLFAVISVLTVIVLLMLIVPRVVKGNPQRGVIVQGIYRSNLALFAIPLAENIYGSGSSLLATMLVAFIIPIYNVCAVIVLEYFSGASSSKLNLVKKICTNPLILGIVAGAVFYFLHIPIPSFIAKPFKVCADMATPLALFALGGTLRFTAVKGNARILTCTLIVKMILLPLVIFSISMLFPFSPVERFMLLIVFATPTAVSSYPMAQNMGGDGPLAGQLVVFTTTLSIFTLFLFIFILRLLGLI